MLLTRVHEIPRVLLDIKMKIEVLTCKRNDCVLEDTESNVKDAIFKPDFLHEEMLQHYCVILQVGNKW